MSKQLNSPMRPLPTAAKSLPLLLLLLLQVISSGHVSFAKGAKAGPVTAQKQKIFSLSQEQKNSEILKIWGVPACVVMGSERPRGVYVTGFTGDGLGSQMGLQVGDVVLSLNGHVLIDARQADSVLTQMKSGRLKAVVARASGARGAITLLSPTIIYSADPLNQTYSSQSSDSNSSATASNLSGSNAPTELTISALEDYMFGLVNQDRAANGGLPPLVRSRQLSTLARKYADDMKKRNFFAHDDPDGLTPVGRARRDGIEGSIWENLATEFGNRNYRSLVQRGQEQMMNEPPNNPYNHRGCILSTHHHCVGIGVSVAASRVYCVQEFSPDSIP